ncbi:MAG: hypothetical protein WCF67_05580 [Chitinophagaceae bacterium]
MKHLITTYCNRYKGDFLIDHWLRSLQEHVKLDNIDIMVIDFGLSEEQRQRLTEKGVILNPQEAAGRMSNVHYSHLAGFLQQHQYDQVLYSDCGDLVFQQDISALFESNKDRFRLVLEPDFNFYLHRSTLGLEDVKKDQVPVIQSILGNKPTANCGFVLGPSQKLAGIWKNYLSFCDSAEKHGTDQLIINTIAYKEGFEELPRKFNYVTFLNNEKMYIDSNGLYCNRDGVIPVVHNAGRYDFARRIRDFGYRTGSLKPKVYSDLFRAYYKVVEKISRVV